MKPDSYWLDTAPAFTGERRAGPGGGPTSRSSAAASPGSRPHSRSRKRGLASWCWKRAGRLRSLRPQWRPLQQRTGPRFLGRRRALRRGTSPRDVRAFDAGGRPRREPRERRRSIATSPLRQAEARRQACAFRQARAAPRRYWPGKSMPIRRLSRKQDSAPRSDRTISTADYCNALGADAHGQNSAPASRRPLRGPEP